MKKRDSFGSMVLGMLVANLTSVIVGIFLSSFFLFQLSEFLVLISMIASMGFHLFFIYHEGWICGAADYNRVKCSRAKEQKWKGELVGLCGSAPTVLLAALSLLSDAGAFHQVTVMGQDLSVIVYRIWNSPFRFLFQELDAFPILYFLPVLVMVIMAGFGYRIGYRQIRLSDYLVYSRKKDE